MKDDRVSFVRRVGVAPGTTTLVVGPTNDLGALCAKDPPMPYITPPSFVTGTYNRSGYFQPTPSPQDPTGFLDPYGTDTTLRAAQGAQPWTPGDLLLFAGVGFIVVSALKLFQR